MTKLERIKEAYKYLFGKGIVSSQKDIAEKIGANKASISLVFKGDEKYLTDNFFRRFSEAYPIINASWLISEKGEMTNEEGLSVVNDDPETPYNCSKCKEKQRLIDQLIGENNILREQAGLPIPERNKKVS